MIFYSTDIGVDEEAAELDLVLVEKDTLDEDPPDEEVENIGEDEPEVEP